MPHTKKSAPQHKAHSAKTTHTTTKHQPVEPEEAKPLKVKIETPPPPEETAKAPKIETVEEDNSPEALYRRQNQYRGIV